MLWRTSPRVRASIASIHPLKPQGQPTCLIISNLQKSVEAINVVRRGHEFDPSLTGQHFLLFFFECVHFTQINFPLKTEHLVQKRKQKEKRCTMDMLALQIQE